MKHCQHNAGITPRVRLITYTGGYAADYTNREPMLTPILLLKATATNTPLP
jgi:hypothetical protein